LRQREDRERLLEPAADRTVEEVAARLAVAGIVEAGDGEAVPFAERIKGAGLAAGHVGAVSAEPEKPGRPALSHADSHLAARGALAHFDPIRLRHCAPPAARARHAQAGPAAQPRNTPLRRRETTFPGPGLSVDL